MATILEALQGISLYPLPLPVIGTVAVKRGLSLIDEATPEEIKGSPYRLAKADLLAWLALAPNVSQGGQSFTFNEDERKHLRALAQALYEECGEDQQSAEMRPRYGYKGSRL